MPTTIAPTKVTVDSVPAGRETRAGPGQNHEQQARIPATEDVEEPENLRRHGHPGKTEADAEDGSRARGYQSWLHRMPPSTCRATNTVSMPVAMKLMVAVSDRTERRAMPQIP